jgi:hypothetical protein
MRGYIFTQRERKAIMRFAETRKRDNDINDLISALNKNWRTLLQDFKLLMILKRLENAGY